MDTTQILDKVAVTRSIDTKWLGRRIHSYRSVDSTNDLLNQLASQGEPAGTLLIAEFQKLGKGRFNRRWSAPVGTSLLFSLLFRPTWDSSRINWLSMMAGLAATRAIDAESKLVTRLKWPNDVVINLDSVWHKIGGLLHESEITGQKINHVILGTGLNINIPFDQLPTTHSPVSSLLVATGHPVSRLGILGRFLDVLEKLYEAAENGDSPKEQWAEKLLTIGEEVIVSNVGQDDPIEGLAEGVDDWGNLLVRDKRSQLHKISAGDVSLRV